VCVCVRERERERESERAHACECVCAHLPTSLPACVGVRGLWHPTKHRWWYSLTVVWCCHLLHSVVFILH